MKLTIETVNVREAVFGERTFFENGILHINREELKKEISKPQFASLTIELARPGESCRISRVGDVIQPRVKPDDPQGTFPGSFGQMKRAGCGRTLALEGIAVVETWEMDAPSQTFIDMSGPGAFYTPYSKTFNLVITAVPEGKISRTVYADALKSASLGAAVYLARAAIGHTPDRSESFDLSAGAEYGADGSKLPRVAYIYQIFSHKALVEPLLYGDDCHGILPTPIHPNEILDGALINHCYEQVHNEDVTYMILNHSVIRELYRRHGKDLYFAGVIIRNSPSSQEGKQRMAMMATTQAKYTLQADAAILTKEGGGHPQLDMALNCDYCEELGIKTVLLITEFLTTGGGKQETLIFNTKRANAIVSAGYSEMVDFPPMQTVYGGNRIPDVAVPLNEGFTAMCKLVRGSLSQLGSSYITSQEQ